MVFKAEKVKKTTAYQVVVQGSSQYDGHFSATQQYFPKKSPIANQQRWSVLFGSMSQMHTFINIVKAFETPLYWAVILYTEYQICFWSLADYPQEYRFLLFYNSSSDWFHCIWNIFHFDLI